MVRLRRSPCVLYGARQVGKSTLASVFANTTGREVIIVNFWKDTDRVYPKIFSPRAEFKDILQKLEIHLNRTIDPQTSIYGALSIDHIERKCCDAGGADVAPSARRR